MNPNSDSRDSILISPVAMTNSETATANLDVAGAGSWATIRVALSAEVNTNAIGPEISLLESDDTEVTNFATITADRTAEDITTAKTVVYHVDLRGRKRYLRLSVTTETTTNDDAVVSAIATVSDMTNGPSSAAEMISGDGAAVVV